MSPLTTVVALLPTASPILCFIMLFWRIRMGAHAEDWWSDFLVTAVVWGLLVTVATETLSFFNLVTLPAVTTFWVLASLAVFFVRRGSADHVPWNIPRVSVAQGVSLTGVVAIIIIVGIIALVAPPNNWDSMVYHMARVAHWIQNKSVNFYPTHITTQLYHSPWAEYAILHLQILSSSDRFANLVQWFSMVGSVVGVTAVAKQLGAERDGQILAAVFAVTVPMGILQASSTQNNYVLAFWLICFVYFAGRFSSDPSWRNSILAAASLGLTLLTKPTGYLYALPFLLVLVFSTISRYRTKCFVRLAFMAAFVVTVNLGHYIRTIKLYGPEGQATERRLYANETFSLRFLASNILRNVALHVGTPSNLLNYYEYRVIRSLHESAGIDMNDHRTTWKNRQFQINDLSTHEDNAGNPIQILLLGGLLLLVIKSWTHLHLINVFVYIGCLLAAFLLFCAVLKWQPYHSRLHLPLFILSAPLVGVVASRILGWRISFVVGIVLLCSSTPWVFWNELRPLVGNKNIFMTNRVDQYFANRPRLEADYIGAARFLLSRKCSDIGLVFGANDWEYPLWVTLQASTRPIRIEHFNVDNISSPMPYPNGAFHPCAIISTQLNSESGDHFEKHLLAFRSGPIAVFLAE